MKASQSPPLPLLKGSSDEQPIAESVCGTEKTPLIAQSIRTKELCRFRSEISLQIGTLGDSGVGKSTTFHSILLGGRGMGTREAMSTVGIDTTVCFHPIPPDNERAIRITFWDTAGQERFRTLTASYVRQCNVILILYNVSEFLSSPIKAKGDSERLTNYATMEAAATYWVDEALKSASVNQKRIYLVANKCDLVVLDEGFKRRIHEAFIKRRADYVNTKAKADHQFKQGGCLSQIMFEYDSHFFISAKAGVGIAKMVDCIVANFKRDNNEAYMDLLSGKRDAPIEQHDIPVQATGAGSCGC